MTGALATAAQRAGCVVPVYCTMPDHQHLIVTGTRDDSDIWSAVMRYKQLTGYWLSKQLPGMSWQKDFYDHIIRAQGDLAKHTRYILDNPVRKGLVAAWHAYPDKGAIGCDLEAVLNGIM